MKKLFILALVGCSPIFASKKSVAEKPHYSVCIVSGADEVCSKPLLKNVADGVAYVLSQAPIQGLDLVYEFDTDKPKDKPALPVGHPPVNVPGGNVI